MDKANLVTWEKAIEILRRNPENRDLIFNSYLTDDIFENSRRFFTSGEFAEVLKLIRREMPNARDVLDIPGGNGIATYSFVRSGFVVTTVEPDPSETVGRGAISKVLAAEDLHAEIVNAYGEKLPFYDSSFDVVYVRQGLHHASNLPKMLKEMARVLRPGGLLVACREHVVDDYNQSLKAFLDAQVDHQLYGGENAFTLPDYLAAIRKSGLKLISKIAPYDSEINFYPENREAWETRISNSLPGKTLGILLPKSIVMTLARFALNRRKSPGRLYTFIARKQAS